jgi:hypothetical protein
MTQLRVAAIYLTLGDAAFLGASISSIYAQVDRILVGTTYDRDWAGRPRVPDTAVADVLSGCWDPDNKIELVVLRETNEARARNRLMDLVSGSRASAHVKPQGAYDVPSERVDWFLVIDADEIYDPGAVSRLVTFAEGSGAKMCRAGAVRYFKRWNYRIAGLEWSTVLVRRDARFNDLRNFRVARWRRALALVWRGRLGGLLRGFVDAPAHVGVFHHGSYVGPRERIVEKLTSFGHAHESNPHWLTEVYDPWTLRSTDFHPVWPPLFPGADFVPTAELPDAVASHDWPPGYLDR